MSRHPVWKRPLRHHRKPLRHHRDAPRKLNPWHCSSPPGRGDYWRDMRHHCQYDTYTSRIWSRLTPLVPMAVWFSKYAGQPQGPTCGALWDPSCPSLRLWIGALGHCVAPIANFESTSKVPRSRRDQTYPWRFKLVSDHPSPLQLAAWWDPHFPPFAVWCTSWTAHKVLVYISCSIPWPPRSWGSLDHRGRGGAVARESQRWSSLSTSDDPYGRCRGSLLSGNPVDHVFNQVVRGLPLPCLPSNNAYRIVVARSRSFECVGIQI